MYICSGSSLNELFARTIVDIYDNGKAVTSRGQKTREFHPAMIQLEQPRHRILTIPGRKINPFSCVAEFCWIMGGSNELTYLSYYLKNAVKFSDDGTTWRAGYGPRLRRWKDRDGSEIDQFAKCLECFARDIHTRQAVMMVFDPTLDYQVSKDIPCTNWLHFMVRDGALDLNVVMRSNDLMWGWSGVNVFNFTMMQELMACWLGVDVGVYYHMSDSFHLYEDLYPQTLLDLNIPKLKETGLEWDLYSSVQPTKMDVLPRQEQSSENGFLRFGWDIERLMKLEEQWRTASDAKILDLNASLSSDILESFHSRFIASLFSVLTTHALMQHGLWSEAFKALAHCTMDDFKVSCLEFLWRKIKSKDEQRRSAGLEDEWNMMVAEHPKLLSDPKIAEYIKNG